MQNNYTVINASAGSGKTYTLVMRILMLCLRHPEQEKTIRHILALTFTNKAANEMKDRIMKWLVKFSDENYENDAELESLQKAYEAQDINLSKEVLHKRSKNLLQYLLHHYSVLSIGTIDKFNTKLVRSFSQELGLNKTFSLEINPEHYVREAVDQMLDQIGGDNDVTETFLEYALQEFDNNHKVNLNKVLVDTANTFMSDIHFEELKKNENFTTEEYKNFNKNIRNQIQELEKESLEVAKKSITLIENNGLEVADFSGGATRSIARFFYKYLEINEGKDLSIFPANEESALANYRKGASTKAKKEGKETAVESILETLIENRQIIIDNYVNIYRKNLILNALLPLKVNKDLQAEINKLEEENDIQLLSKFNILINQNLKDEPASFIYEKIGTRYNHYFLDEFQDTSHLQWENLIPLRDHVVASDGTSFTIVGDPKQSIYRFRGGESQLMTNIINHQEITPKNAEVENLKYNFRSAQSIVHFNNEIYRSIAAGLEEKEHQKIFGEDGEQIPHSKKIGRVKAHLIPNSVKEEWYESVGQKMANDIQECVDLGYQLSDITILARNSSDIVNLTQQLSLLKINYKNELTSIKTISDRGLTLNLSKTLLALIELLRWEIQPEDQTALVMMLYYLNDLGRISIDDFTKDLLSILNLNDHVLIKEELHNRYGLNLKETSHIKFNVYNYVEQTLKNISVKGKETDYIITFLESLYGFSQHKGQVLKDVIEDWEEETSEKTVQASENVDAVKIMTVHKAKGLEFPVVLYPVEHANKDSAFNDWLPTDNDYNVASINIKQAKKEIVNYDEELEEFNKKNEYKNKIDRICLHYVATTRPVSQLFLYVEKPKKESTSEIYDFVESKNLKDEEAFDLFPFDNQDILKKEKAEDQEQFKKIEVAYLSSEQSKKSTLKIATPSKTYQERNKKVKDGILIHEILAKVNYPKDLSSVLETYTLDGILLMNEVEELSKKIKNIFTQYPSYFDENWEVLNEKDIMISESIFTEKIRPDRMLRSGNEIKIVDFKTGEPKKKDNLQMEKYKTIISKLGYTVKDTKLIYV